MVIVFFFLDLLILSFLRKKKEDRGKNDVDKDENIKERSFITDEPKKVELKTIIIEQPGLDNELDNLSLEQQKKESSLIPSELKTQIEKIVLQILYKEKSVKTFKLLNDRVLESAAQKKITVSEKTINLIIHQMNKIGIIEFTQKEGWKIKI
ncbi:MAG: hypothetical protein ACFFFT_06195 [Candidatus Thorarchaeota archaeon]